MFVLTNILFFILESTPNHFLVQAIHRGIVVQEFHLPLAGIPAVNHSPSRRRRVRANMATNEDISIASGPVTSVTAVDLTAEAAATTDACFICTNIFAFGERVVCPGCNNFLCLQCYASMDSFARGRNVNCPFCRRRLLSNTDDDELDSSV